jgi:transposase-like protein
MSEDLPGVIRFLDRFSDEEACWEHLRQARWPNGFVCPMCGEDEDWIFLEDRKRWHCYPCGHQTSITSQTILEDTKLDLRTWFLAAYLIFITKKGKSPHDLARKLEVHQETAWYMYQRLAVMAAPNIRRLFGVVEIDESYLGGKREEDEKGRSLAKAPVLGAVEAKGESAGDLVLAHTGTAQWEAIEPNLREHLDEEAVVHTDGFRAYDTLGKDLDRTHLQVPISRQDEDAHEIFPWIHIVWGNLKRVIEGVHTKASRAQLQDYLDLFAYRFNHRAQLAEGLAKALEGLVRVGRRTREQLKGGVLADVY